MSVRQRLSQAVFLHIIFVGLLSVGVLLWSSRVLALNPDVCIEDGGTADCTGPVAKQYKYYYTSAVWNGPYAFSSEQAAVGHFENAVASAYHACSTSLHNPPWQPLPAGSTVGDVRIPEPPIAGGDNFSLSFTLATEVQQRKWEMRVTGTGATNSNPPCVNAIGSGNVQLLRVRTVDCPAGYQANYYTAPTYSYCWRYPTAGIDPPKNLGPCTKDCDLMLGNPANAATGNKYQEESDYRGAGAFPLEYVRRYNSFSYVGPDFVDRSPNWRATYDRAVLFNEHPRFPAADVYRHDGRVLRFKRIGNQFVPQSDVSDRLTRQVDGSGNTTGWTLTSESDETETYDASGRLTSVRNRAGVTHTLARDTQGRITTITHSFGQQIVLTYDVYDRLSTMTVPGGAVYVFSYVSTSKKLSGVTYPGGAARSYHYENSSFVQALTGITDESSTRFSTYAYNASGKVSQTEHAGGVLRFSFSYPTNTTTTVTDPLSTSRTWTHGSVQGSARAFAISQVCPTCGSASKTKTFDANGNVATRTDFNNNETRYTFDLTRNLETSRIGAYGTPNARTITTGWHATYRLPTQIDEPNRRTTFTHDANGNVLTRTVTDLATSESRTWTYTYNTFGQVLTGDGPRTDVNDITTYTYYNCTTGYQCGQIETITNALNQVVTYNTYNAHGQPLTITDPNSVVTTLTYDQRQQLTSRTIGTEVTSFEYWPAGLLKKATLPDGSYLDYTYDAAHRLTGIADSEGNRIAYTLDAMGNRTAENVFDPSNALTQTRMRVFNTLNQLWKEIGAAGTPSVTTEFGYDNNANQTSINAPLGRNIGQSYDELNRLTQVTDPATGLTKYGYNALDQLISVNDPRNKVTSYIYNALGDLTEQVSPDTGTTTNTYDSAGNLKTKTDARGKTSTYSYDALNRVTQLVYPDQTIGYTYDQGANALGRLSGISDASGSSAWSYDAQGRVTLRQQTIGSLPLLVAYSYNTAGQLHSLTLPSGNAITYSYANGKIASLTLNGSTTLLSNVLYQPFGPTLGWTWGNATLAIREYDTDGKVTDIDSAGLKTYAYDDAFRITGIADADDPNLSQTYGYDVLDRLTSTSGTGLNQSWTYDVNGNRLTQGGSQASTYTIATANNRVSSISGSLTRTYGYDAAGNTTSDGTATFTYDDAGRMVSVMKAGVTTSYQLNALGQRVRKTTGGNGTYFVHDEAGQLIGEYDNAGSLIQETVWFGDTPVATLRPSGIGGVNAYYVHTDHLNTPRRISRPSDNVVVWRWDSDPFGATAANEDPDSDSNLFVYNLRFPGQYYDPETGLHYNDQRDGYDPATGRYTQSDPIGLEGGLNTYAYVGGNPISRVDPEGLQAVLPWIEPLIRPMVQPRPMPMPTTIDPVIGAPDVVIDPTTGQPDPKQTRECQDLKRKMDNIRKDIEKRQGEIRANPQNLPERLPPGARLREDVRGHRVIINKLWNNLRELEKEYDRKCMPRC